MPEQAGTSAAASGSGAQVTRRRSQRLSKKLSDELENAAEKLPEPREPVEQAPPEIMDDNSMMDPEVEAEVSYEIGSHKLD
jgi:hypothetical protein